MIFDDDNVSHTVRWVQSAGSIRDNELTGAKSGHDADTEYNL
mgnify:FL=1